MIYRTWKFKKEVAAMSDIQLDYEKRLIEQRLEKLEFMYHPSFTDKYWKRELKDYTKTNEIMEKEIDNRKKYPKMGAYKNASAKLRDKLNKEEN